MFSFSYCGERTLSNFGLQNRYKFFNWLFVYVYACQFITKKYNSNFIDFKLLICVNACDCYTALPHPTFIKTGRWFSISDIIKRSSNPWSQKASEQLPTSQPNIFLWQDFRWLVCGCRLTMCYQNLYFSSNYLKIHYHPWAFSARSYRTVDPA